MTNLADIRPPQIHELLADLLALSRAQTSAIRDLQTEVQALRASAARARSEPPKVATHAELAAELFAHVTLYWENFQTPMHLFKATRHFGRRFKAAETSVASLLASELAEKLASIQTDTGGLMLIPRAIWDAADEGDRQHWIGSTDKQLREHRRAVRDLMATADPAPSAPSEKSLTDSPANAKPESEGTPQ